MGFIDKKPENCSGCRSCELACSLKHFGYFDFSKSRIHIEQEEEHSVIEIHQCIQCDERSCVNVCPTNALSIDTELGYICLDEEACTGCRACYKGCKYNGVMWDDENEKPLICDLCEGEPECLKPCRLHQAITRSIKEIVL